MYCSINVIALSIIIPALILQYVLALYCLSQLAYIKMKVWQYVIWNVSILLVLYIGAIVFLIVFHNRLKQIRLEKRAERDKALAPDPISIDCPTEDNISLAETTETNVSENVEDKQAGNVIDNVSESTDNK